MKPRHFAGPPMTLGNMRSLGMERLIASNVNDACAMGLEGIDAKRRDRPYRSGRSPDWIKVKNPDARAATRMIEG
jgi:ATP-dependent DNA ligase